MGTSLERAIRPPILQMAPTWGAGCAACRSTDAGPLQVLGRCHGCPAGQLALVGPGLERLDLAFDSAQSSSCPLSILLSALLSCTICALGLLGQTAYSAPPALMTIVKQHKLFWRRRSLLAPSPYQRMRLTLYCSALGAPVVRARTHASALGIPRGWDPGRQGAARVPARLLGLRDAAAAHGPGGRAGLPLDEPWLATNSAAPSPADRFRGLLASTLVRRAFGNRPMVSHMAWDREFGSAMAGRRMEEKDWKRAPQ